MKLQKEIQRRLRHVKNIKFEPTLLQKPLSESENESDISDINNNQKYRMKACDGFSVLEEEIVKHDADCGERLPTETVRQYLYRLHTSGILTKVPLELIRNVVLLYENARHTPQPFEEPEYRKFKENLNLIITQLSSGKTRPGVKRTIDFSYSRLEMNHSPCNCCHRPGCSKTECSGRISGHEKGPTWLYKINDPATFPGQQRPRARSLTGFESGAFEYYADQPREAKITQTKKQRSSSVTREPSFKSAKQF
ncbi:unnamed protein product [Acanthosepion pharaonis]|uniref:Uncharacterized protein n=1 Tax=Acanthosepion pharaonis TaxID=158019 RepID=A0A812DYC2_ACAPH|nr:unnamed protein product [Sepia pharaonis]